MFCGSYLKIKTAMQSLLMDWNFIYGFTISGICVVMNVCAIVILITTKKLRRSRFHTLVLFLSISDSAMGMEVILHHIFNYLNTNENVYLYGCMVLKHAAGGTLGFSSYQTLMICLERLQATFATKVSILRKLTSNTTVGIAFILFQLYIFIPFLFEVINNGPHPCHVSYTSKRLYILTVDIPLLLCSSITIVTYFIVIKRIRKQKNMQLHLDEQQKKKKILHLTRMRSNMVTLGIIITVTSVTLLPRVHIGVVSFFAQQNESVMLSFLISNHLTLLHPLFDPLIYLLRIKEVRDLIKCYRKSNSVAAVNDVCRPDSTVVNVVHMNENVS